MPPLGVYNSGGISLVTAVHQSCNLSTCSLNVKILHWLSPLFASMTRNSNWPRYRPPRIHYIKEAHTPHWEHSPLSALWAQALSFLCQNGCLHVPPSNLMRVIDNLREGPAWTPWLQHSVTSKTSRSKGNDNPALVRMPVTPRWRDWVMQDWWTAVTMILE